MTSWTVVSKQPVLIGSAFCISKKMFREERKPSLTYQSTPQTPTLIPLPLSPHTSSCLPSPTRRGVRERTQPIITTAPSLHPFSSALSVNRPTQDGYTAASRVIFEKLGKDSKMSQTFISLWTLRELPSLLFTCSPQPPVIVLSFARSCRSGCATYATK